MQGAGAVARPPYPTEHHTATRPAMKIVNRKMNSESIRNPEPPPVPADDIVRVRAKVHLGEIVGGVMQHMMPGTVFATTRSRAKALGPLLVEILP